MTNIEKAWNDLYAAQTDAIGEQLTASVNNEGCRAIISDITLDEILAAGGQAEAGGFTLQIPLSELGEEPAKFSPVVCRGKTLQALNVNSNNGIVYITAGDPVANE